jgi:hypothetical protein
MTDPSEKNRAPHSERSEERDITTSDVILREAKDLQFHSAELPTSPDLTDHRERTLQNAPKAQSPGRPVPQSPGRPVPQSPGRPVLPKDGEDFYWEGPYMVFTEAWHRKRGYCCGSNCRHCPWNHENVPTDNLPPPPDRA